MAEVVWTDEAKLWLREIFEYIAADHPDNAARVVERILSRAESLAEGQTPGAENSLFILASHHRPRPLRGRDDA